MPRMAVAMLLALVFVVSGGCGKQDPFADKPDEIRNGQLPGQKPAPKPEKVSSEALILDAKVFYTFKEGEESEIRFSGRVLGKLDGEEPELGKNFEIKIENLSAFEGASYDSKTGVFKWKPKAVVIGEGYSQVITMNLLMETTKGNSWVTTKQVNIFVMRDANDPVIESVEDLVSKPIKEQEIRLFKVVVTDLDAHDSPIGHPKLIIANSTTGSNVASRVSLVKAPDPDPVLPGRWIFTLQFDAKAELVKSTSVESFGLIAVSRHGVMSGPMTVNVALQSVVSEPVITWSSGFDKEQLPQFRAGELNTFAFTVYDLKQEGSVNGNFRICPTGAKCACGRMLDLSNGLLCRIEWEIPDDLREKKVDVELVATNQTIGSFDPPLSVVFKRQLLVKASRARKESKQ